ncbi:DUF1499 domain-containing protein [Photobacterium sp. J15]|uniref:DUF1499 domain-containing protein n=1 Tax=Photobacterium sp. J15 TaxID=265901 RepID=UPI0007E3B2B2|nr:DUF1499 domain-containing protein [Photobacterium sp. J15]
MKKASTYILVIFSGLLLFGCSNSDQQQIMADRTGSPCGEKPNCVSTLESREDFTLAQFTLSQQGGQNWQAIIDNALELPGASMAQQEDNYFRVECRSRIFGFVDDFEVRRQGDTLIVRSESRTGYSDFGVNRERAEQFRQLLIAAGLLKP